MTVAIAIYSRLSNFAALVALVSTRIYPVEAPGEASRPYCVFLTVSSQHLQNVGGPSMVVNSRIQVDSYAGLYIEASAIADQVRAALDGWNGTEASIVVLGSSCIDHRDFIEDLANPPLYRVSQDFSVWFRE